MHSHVMSTTCVREQVVYNAFSSHKLRELVPIWASPTEENRINCRVNCVLFRPRQVGSYTPSQTIRPGAVNNTFAIHAVGTFYTCANMWWAKTSPGRNWFPRKPFFIKLIWFHYAFVHSLERCQRLTIPRLIGTEKSFLIPHKSGGNSLPVPRAIYYVIRSLSNSAEGSSLRKN